MVGEVPGDSLGASGMDCRGLCDKPKRSQAERVECRNPDDGVAMQRLTFQRCFPEIGEKALQRKLDKWLAREDELP